MDLIFGESEGADLSGRSPRTRARGGRRGYGKGILVSAYDCHWSGWLDQVLGGGQPFGQEGAAVLMHMLLRAPERGGKIRAFIETKLQPGDADRQRGRPEDGIESID